MTSVLEAARKKIKLAKIPPLKSDEAIYYYDVAAKRSIYADNGDSSLFEKSFDYFIQASEKGARASIGSSKTGGHPHLPKGWKLPKEWKALRFYAQLNVADFKKYDVDDLFPAHGIFYIFLHPEEAKVGVHFEADPKAELVERKDLSPFPRIKTERFLSFAPRFIFHMLDVEADEAKTAKQIPKKLQEELAKLLGGTMAVTNPTLRIFGRPQFWQGEDEGGEPEDSDDDDDDEMPRPPKNGVLLFHGQIEDTTLHFWIDRAPLKKGDGRKVRMTFSGS